MPTYKDEFIAAMIPHRHATIALGASPVAWHATLAMIQLGLRHPHAGEVVAAATLATHVAREIEAELAALDPAIARVCADGWHGCWQPGTSDQ